MERLRLLVFGARWDATRPDAASAWTLIRLTGEGKRVPVNLVVGPQIGAAEVATHVADLLHEATPSHGDPRVLQLPDG
jgi:hypothetical protein